MVDNQVQAGRRPAARPAPGAGAGVQTGTGRGRVAKRQAIMQAAQTVFGREGYTHAGIEAIAAAAGVSSRTIYNHFQSKQQLFTAVIIESSTQVADALIRLIDHHLTGVTTPGALQPALVALGCQWAGPQAEFTDHFAIVGHLYAEAAHLPPDLLQAWSTAGPQRAEQHLAHHLRRLAGTGLLHLHQPPASASRAGRGEPDDGAAQATQHLLLLTVAAVATRTYHGAIPLTGQQTTALVTAGVRAFLDGHRPR
ncbi:TetR/AcrR family transcriptional regulator [Actinomadura fulvescens]|uniref:TetR/AcrR family transcriptional regulator n=1 Tax=Actinomadura fulvescens TaxID=46160 RepID=UPI0031CED767